MCVCVCVGARGCAFECCESGRKTAIEGERRRGRKAMVNITEIGERKRGRELYKLRVLVGNNGSEMSKVLRGVIFGEEV